MWAISKKFNVKLVSKYLLIVKMKTITLANWDLHVHRRV